MTRSPVGPLGTATLGARAARVLTAEFARRTGPTTGLVVDATPGSAVLAAAIGALAAQGRLAVVTPDVAAMREHVAALGRWVADRLQVLDSLAAADPADVVMVAEPLAGTAEEVRATLDGLAKLVADGGVLVVAGVALPLAPAAGAARELDRQSALFGVGSDLVLRNAPPVRVHRLRHTAADPATAARLAPFSRPSSVRLSRDMHVDANGVAAAGIALGLAAAARLARPRSALWLLPAAAALPVAAFFRDPHREVPADESLVLAASDGRVLSVERITDDRFGGDGAQVEYLRVAVFLSVLDVHVNRSPVAGRVVDYFLVDGGFAAAMRPDAEHNVAAYTVLDTPRGRVVVAQRTGLLARRIVQRAPAGALLARGERFGLIRFGSRTDVYLPATEVQPLVAPRDRVTAGTSPIARWR
jgi:phosphatidylserine decarboxylase